MLVSAPASVHPVYALRTGRASDATAHAPAPSLGHPRRLLRVGLTPAAKTEARGDWRVGGGRAGSPSGSRSGANPSENGGTR